MRIVFMGTPEFAVEALNALISDGQEVALVVTRPDKPRGRGYRVEHSPIKKVALSHDIPVLTPKTLKDPLIAEELKAVQADIFIVAAYGMILPKTVLDIPAMGCINIHASLLPALRGAAPINRAIMEGHTRGGVTIMHMDEGLDTGDILLQREMDIPHTMTAGEYHDEMAKLGGVAIVEYLRLLEKGKTTRQKQDNSKATYAEKINTKEAQVSFFDPATQVYNHIRGLSPYPGAYGFLCKRRIKILEGVIGDKTGTPGTIVATGEEGIEVACAEGSIIIKVLCVEGKGTVAACDFLRGNKAEIGECFNV